MMSASTSLPRSACAGRAQTAATKAGPTATAAEKRFEEIAETRATEFELDPAASRRHNDESRRPVLPRPILGRLKSARLIPIRAQLSYFFRFSGSLRTS